MTISIRNPDFTGTLPVKFEGCTDNSQLDIDLTIPLGKLNNKNMGDIMVRCYFYRT